MNSRERAQRTILPLQQALHLAAKKYPGGIGGIAGAYALNANSFQHRLNPNAINHGPPNIDDLEAVLSLTHDAGVLDSIGSMANVIWIHLPAHAEGATASAMLQQIGEASAQLGQLAREVGEAIADNIIDRDELAAFEKTALRINQAIHGLIAQARAAATAAEGNAP